MWWTAHSSWRPKRGLLEALEEAKAQYECAKQDAKQALILGADLGSTHPDGSPRRAISSENEARRQYMHALEAFNRFILDGKLPEEKLSTT